jgi:hypothetical protein
MADSVFASFGNYPSDAELEISQATFRTGHTDIVNRIEEVPENFTGMIGQVMAVKDDERGFCNCGSTALTAVTFAQKPVKGFKVGAVTVTGSVSLTDNSHGGVSIMMTNGSAATVTVSISANPASGISADFTCEIARAHNASAVQVVASGGATLRNPQGHTRISQGGIVRLRLHGSDLYFWGYTEA